MIRFSECGNSGPFIDRRQAQDDWVPEPYQDCDAYEVPDAVWLRYAVARRELLMAEDALEAAQRKVSP